MRKWYEELFRDYGEKYDREVYTRGTVRRMSSGLTDVDSFGARPGAFSRADKLTADDFEMLVIAKK